VNADATADAEPLTPRRSATDTQKGRRSGIDVARRVSGGPSVSSIPALTRRVQPLPLASSLSPHVRASHRRFAGRGATLSRTSRCSNRARAHARGVSAVGRVISVTRWTTRPCRQVRGSHSIRCKSSARSRLRTTCFMPLGVLKHLVRRRSSGGARPRACARESSRRNRRRFATMGPVLAEKIGRPITADEGRFSQALADLPQLRQSGRVLPRICRGSGSPPRDGARPYSRLRRLGMRPARSDELWHYIA